MQGLYEATDEDIDQDDHVAAINQELHLVKMELERYKRILRAGRATGIRRMGPRSTASVRSLRPCVQPHSLRQGSF